MKLVVGIATLQSLPGQDYTVLMLASVSAQGQKGRNLRWPRQALLINYNRADLKNKYQLSLIGPRDKLVL